jgi:hypothetical protein
LTSNENEPGGVILVAVRRRALLTTVELTEDEIVLLIQLLNQQVITKWNDLKENDVFATALKKKLLGLVR